MRPLFLFARRPDLETIWPFVPERLVARLSGPFQKRCCVFQAAFFQGSWTESLSIRLSRS